VSEQLTQTASRSSVHEDLRVAAALQRGDEQAFGALVDAHHAAMVRVASQYVPSAAVAEEVAQEAWIAFVSSLERYEGRSSLKTWLFSTLLNCARNRKRAEVRSVPFSALGAGDENTEPSIDENRFLASGVWAGHWSVAPRPFGEDGERRLLRGELRDQLQNAVAALPPTQREVLTLRDVEGFSGVEVSELLGLSEANQRVLLHRARGRVRAALEAYFSREGEA
jgi:RNA polymerase sigma-70 factor (ECF subfamily)